MDAPRTRAPLVAAVAAAALLLGYASLAGAGDGRMAPAPLPAPPDRTEPARPPGDPSLGDLVPGFEGTLVAQLGVWGRVDVAQWPSGRTEPVTLPMPRAISLSTDAARRLFVGVAPAALEGRGQAMYVGSLADLRPAAVNVGSAAFHATSPGRLAWLEIDGDLSRLRVGSVNPGGLLAAESPAIAEVALDHRLVGWGDWGFLLAGWDPEADIWIAYLLAPGGAERWRLPAVDAAVSPHGTVLLAHAAEVGGFRWSQGSAWPDGTPVEALDWVAEDAGLGAAWSPDGDLVVFVAPGASGLGSRLDVRRADGTAVRSVDVPLQVAGVSWSHDGRFVLARAAQPERRNVVFFFDTLDGSLDEVEFDAWVQLAVTRPGQR